MAQYTNAYSTYDSNRIRETFSDTIADITATETPLHSNIKKEKCDGTTPEWSIDELATPNLANAQVQGFTYSFDATSPTTKISNKTQIFQKSFVVTNTNEVVRKAGPKKDWNRQKARKMLELRIDIECALANNNATVAGGNSTAPEMAGLRSWIATNDSLGSGGASGGWNSGTSIVDAATNGTQRAFTKTLLDDVIEDVFNEGGNPKIIMGSPYIKRVFTSQLMNGTGIAQHRTNVGSGHARAIGSVDEYQSDFGLLSFVPNRQWTRYDVAADGGNGTGTLTRNVFVLDPDMLSVMTLRPIQEDKDITANADAKPGQLVAECTLCVKNEAGQGVVADCYGLTSSS